MVHWDLYPLLVKSLRLGTLSPHVFTLLFPFNIDIICNYPHPWHITLMSEQCSDYIISFLVGNQCSCVQRSEQKSLAQSMSTCASTLNLLMVSEILTLWVHLDK